jgi:hypothetical protein
MVMRFRTWVSAVLTIGILVSLSVSAVAHHSIATFWNTEGEIEVTGTLVAARIMNPHSQLVWNDENGERWVGTSASLQGMREAGYAANDTIAPGTGVTISGNPPHANGMKGVLIYQVTTEDGRIFDIRNPGQ